MNIDLYIGGKRVDLADDSFVLFNYTKTELSSPETIRNAHSQQLTIPSTATNNAIFGASYRLDRRTGYGAFDSIKKTPFIIYTETGEVLESGYCKLDRIHYKGREIYSYYVTLYGAIGGYFYDLSVMADGTAMNLGHLQYKTSEGEDWTPNGKSIDLDASTIYGCWDEIGRKAIFGNPKWATILNFAPCYNGIPADFDAKKALVTGDYFVGVKSTTLWKPHPRADGAFLVTMPTDKTGDEMRDYRAYLQRPVLSIKAFIEALVNRGGLYVTPNAKQRLIQNMWVTLPLPTRAASYKDYDLTGIFGKSMSPADLLVSLAKCFNLVFLSGLEYVTLMTDEDFYAGGKSIDLEGRVDKPSISVKPNGVDAKWYLFKDEVGGAFADSYKELYNRDYASQKVNTGWDFDSNIKDVSSQRTKGAAQVLEQSRMFVSKWSNLGVYFPCNTFEDISFVAYNSDGSDSSTISVPANDAKFANTLWCNEEFHYYDALDKPQFEDKEKKPVDGAGVLLYYNGYADMSTDEHLRWRLTDDEPFLFELLNEGRPCWDLRRYEGQLIDHMPTFSRWGADNLDWGIPAEIGVPAVSIPSNTLFRKYWRRSIAEMYDKDAMVVTAKVNLRGMEVGQSLLRNEYWFDNSHWRLNRIVNHSLTTDGLTECEFIRRIDVGDLMDDSIELQETQMSLSSAAQYCKAYLKATANWKVISKPSWVKSITPASGGAVLTYKAVDFEVSANIGTTRMGRIVFGLVDSGLVASMRITQVGSAPTPPSEDGIWMYREGTELNYDTISGSGGFSYCRLWSDGAYKITSNVDWISDYSHRWEGASAVDNLQILNMVAPNDTGAPRQGILTAQLVGTTKRFAFIITQESATPPTPEEKYMYLAPNGTLDVEAGVTSHSVSITSNTSWIVEVGAGVKVDGAYYKEGSGNATFTMTFMANESVNVKHNSIIARTTAGGLIEDSLDVIQSAYVPEPPAEEFLTLSRYETHYDQEGGQDSVVLSSSSAWQLVGTIPSWLSVAPQAGYATSGQQVRINATRATSNRTGYLRFRNTEDLEVMWTIYQSLSPTVIYPEELEFYAQGTDIERSADLLIECRGDWEVNSMPEWLTADVESGSGDGTIIFTAEEYEGETDREGDIIIVAMGETFTIHAIQRAAAIAEYIYWQESEPIEVANGETAWVHVVTNAPTFRLDASTQGGGWIVRQSGTTISCLKTTDGNTSVTLVVTTPTGKSASLTLTSRVGVIDFAGFARRASVSSAIYGSYSMTSNEEEEELQIDGASIGIEFLDSNGGTLYSTSIGTPMSIAAGETISDSMTIATQSIVNLYGLSNAVAVRYSVMVDGITYTSVNGIAIQ